LKHIVLYSGGANSAYTAWLINQKYHEDTILLHTPTYSEHPDADRFRKQFADYLNLPITVQADGRDIWKLIEDHHCLPSNRIPFCSRVLKTEQSMKFYKTMTEDFVVYFGYDNTEWRRAQRATARLQAMGIKSAYPLLKSGLSNQDIKDFIRDKLRICLPETYLYLSHNNCLPCFKGSQKHFYQIWKFYPEYFEKAEKAEKAEYNNGHTVFLGITLTELRKQWEAQIPMFTDEEDLRPCMCAI
jgi:3'-phosphoadenosine 5'-phosphosulfate sulfotransferase (PAPS reductase)/FAD synthetase